MLVDGATGIAGGKLITVAVAALIHPCADFTITW